MSNSICDSVSNIAFVTTEYVSRADVIFAFLGFIVGLAAGISICSIL